ncbi:MAG: hypothetical protein KAI62_01050, partial [Actinomycetia bacterium]|nr:hypothetical protein [Actinomycetes bacterium]
MPQGIYKRGRPIQKKLEKLKKIILIDALNRKKTAKEMANDYGVSYGALLIYFKENKINKFRKLVPHYTKSNMGHKSKVKDLRNYIKE